MKFILEESFWKRIEYGRGDVGRTEEDWQGDEGLWL